MKPKWSNSGHQAWWQVPFPTSHLSGPDPESWSSCFCLPITVFNNLDRLPWNDEKQTNKQTGCDGSGKKCPQKGSCNETLVLPGGIIIRRWLRHESDQMGDKDLESSCWKWCNWVTLRSFCCPRPLPFTFSLFPNFHEVSSILPGSHSTAASPLVKSSAVCMVETENVSKTGGQNQWTKPNSSSESSSHRKGEHGSTENSGGVGNQAGPWRDGSHCKTLKHKEPGLVSSTHVNAWHDITLHTQVQVCLHPNMCSKAKNQNT